MICKITDGPQNMIDRIVAKPHIAEEIIETIVTFRNGTHEIREGFGMNAIQRGRLMKLANHLLHGKLGHEEWNFSVLNNGLFDKKGCGTAGCALGECPIVFPRHWKFSKQSTYYFYPTLKSCQFENAFSCAIKFFGIEYGAAAHLFDPNSQKPEEYGGKALGNDAAREEVARNILAFLKKMDKD